MFTDLSNDYCCPNCATKKLAQEENLKVITTVLQPLEAELTKWLEGEYLKKMLNSDRREHYVGLHEGLRISRAHVISAILNLSPVEEEEE